MNERRVIRAKNGRNQAVRIPRGFELPSKGRRHAQGGQLLDHRPGAAEILACRMARLKPLDEELPPITDAPPERVDL